MTVQSKKLDLPQDLVVDGETYECIKSFCYLGGSSDNFSISDIQSSPARD